MLKQLQIENYALIDSLDVQFDNGLTTITGETGAGKSILLGALSLILGQRADLQSLKDKNKKCIIEGTFSLSAINLEQLFLNNDLDYLNPCIFRREINQQGKSRAFINDTPVNLSVMKEIGERLVDIHSQHQNLLAAEASFQFDVLDNYSGQLANTENYKKLYHKWRNLIKINNELKEHEQKAKAEQDYLKFQLDELEKANIIPEECENLEEELQILENAEEIKINFEKARFLLEEADINVTESLNDVNKLISSVSSVSAKYKELTNRLNTAFIEIKDISREINILSEEINIDPQRTLELKERHDLINRLLLKHNVASYNDLIIIQEDFRKRIALLESLDDNILDNEKQINALKKELEDLAQTISNKRKEFIPQMEEEILALLKQLGMPNARFKISISEADVLNQSGKDNLSFLFNANLGGELKEISKIASGGELSRLMLSIKSMTSRKNLLPTIIFDEIDTGISGEIAAAMGDILNKMSKSMQVIAITHLAQIAARGKEHLLVYKISEDGTTKTHIKQLKDNNRINEIAVMLGGKKPSAGMLETAKELITEYNK
ncbi:MAG: DNA repair protein RecN [Bacteroidota bacterium]